MHWLGRLLPVLLVAAGLQLGAVAAEGDQAVEAHVKAGDARLAVGDLPGALDAYHAACGADSGNYLSFFKRATVFLALGRLKQATRDLDTVLELKPDFEQARSRRADANLKLGNFQAAREDYETIGANKYETQLAQVQEAENFVQSAQEAAAAGNHVKAVEDYSAAIQFAASNGELRMARARSHKELGQTGEAVNDLLRSVKLTTANVEGHFMLSQLYFTMGERKDALEQVRECVKLDDNHKDCYDFYKLLKKFNALMDKADEAVQQHRFADVLDGLEKIHKLGVEQTVYFKQLAALKCKSLTELQRTADALTACNKAIEIDGSNAQVYVYRARVREQEADFEAMVQDFQKAAELDTENRQIKEGLARAQKLLKNSKKRDYYKILGLPRTATKKEITKAYRQLAQEWHPDRFDSEEEKTAAQQKFMDIADAKEVLSDPEKRRMFDNGDDPLDAEEERDRQSQRANPFGHGFNPFGGREGFHFKFQ